MSRTWPEMFQHQVRVRLSVTRGWARCHGRFGPPIVPYGLGFPFVTGVLEGFGFRLVADRNEVPK
jgi:hypothetical protein